MKTETKEGHQQKCAMFHNDSDDGFVPYRPSLKRTPPNKMDVSS